ncbi:MAG: heparinase II/III family protein [Rhizobacter sp.]
MSAKTGICAAGILCLCSLIPISASGQVLVRERGVDFSLGGVLGCVPEVGGDWIDDGEWVHRRLIPRDCTVSLDNPPAFSWAEKSGVEQAGSSGASSYRVLLGGPPGLNLVAGTDVPRLMWPQPLPPGDYSWRVSTQTSGGLELSRARRFRIEADAAGPCVVPTGAQVLVRARERERPRLLPQREMWAALRASWQGPRAAEFLRFQRSVALRLHQPPREGDAYDPQAAVNEALAWRYTGQSEMLVSAREKLLQIAAWDPLGPTSETRDDQLNRAVYLALARGLDLLDGELSEAQRLALSSAALARLTQYLQLSAPRGMFETIPYRSHAAGSMHYAVEALVLLAGQNPVVDEMLQPLWDAYRTLYPVWGGQDGGDGNGIVYGWLNLMQPPQTWLALRHAIGVDLACRAYAQRVGLQPVYLTPPVSAAVVARWGGPWPPFGDGADAAYATLPTAVADREFGLYAALLPESNLAALYRWYAAGVRQAQPSTAEPDFHSAALGLLLMRPLGSATSTTFPPAARSAIAFAETGVAAMHSDLQDDQRTSVYFQSGRFGSFNHSRAEQNAFAITLAGEPLLVGGGEYDGPPAGRRLARLTVSKNAITFDGGRGQAEDEAGEPKESMAFRGDLLEARTIGSLSYVTGDAHLAYREQDSVTQQLRPRLDEAIRTVALWRQQKLIVVYDRLRSPTPRRWEWNLHSLQPFVEQGESIRLNAHEQVACLDLHGTPTTFAQAGGTSSGGAIERFARWHGQFTANTPSREAVFVAVIRLGCGPATFDVSIDAALASARVQTKDGAALVFQGPSTGVEGGLP